MVRLKQRYILFDILYPPSGGHERSVTQEELEDFLKFSETPQNALISLHKTSPTSINPKTLTQAIRKVIQDHYGDIGAGTAGLLLNVKYFSNKTSTGIIRCSRSSFDIVIAALALMDKLQDKSVIVRSIHVSGTIKKCEQFSIKRSRDLMVQLQDTKESRFSEVLTSFLNEARAKSVQISDDDNED